MARVLPLLLMLLSWASIAAGATLADGETVWEGRRTFSETVRVEPGAVLRVLPGSRIEFASGRLEVAGRLEARQAEFDGRGWEGIVLKGCDASTRLTGVAVRGARTGVMVVGGAPELRDLVLEGNEVGAELRQKSRAVLADSRLSANSKVGLFVKDDASPRITGNRFENNGRFGAYIYRSAPEAFTGNRFAGQPTGLMVSHFGSEPAIADNHFESNGIAILVDRAARPKLEGNVVVANETGIRAFRRSDPLIEGNRIEGNATGIEVAYSSYPVIRGNDLEGNAMALRLEFQSSSWEAEKGGAAREEQIGARGAFGQAPRVEVTEAERRAGSLDGTVDARGNWWGKEGTAELEPLGPDGNPTFIHDGQDQPTFVEEGREYPLDRVRFAPWLESPAVPRPQGRS